MQGYNADCFRPLSGSFFLSMKYVVYTEIWNKFPSPIGVFLFISVAGYDDCLLGDEFPSPIGVFLFICWFWLLYAKKSVLVSVPYRGLSFYLVFTHFIDNGFESFRPLSGSFFLSIVSVDFNRYGSVTVSVPYRGLSFYLGFKMFYNVEMDSFRPLSGSFFLSKLKLTLQHTTACVSVPYRGLSFYLQFEGLYTVPLLQRFRPLSGSFFLSKRGKNEEKWN